MCLRGEGINAYLAIGKIGVITTMRADDTRDRVLAAAEARLARHGFHGTSFRDLAQDVGIRSASVHYHFPSKADLGRAVADRYAERFFQGLGDPAAPGTSGRAKIETLVAAFREAARHQRRMCLCGLLGSERDGLPEPVRGSVARFFERLLAWLEGTFGEGPQARARALHIVATLEGALLLAHALQDPDLFDQAVAPLLDER